MRIRDKIKAWQGTLLLGTLWLAKMACKPAGLRKIYWSVLIRLIEKTDLFDHAYYSETNTDVARINSSPLLHYVACGDREGRQPLAIFDPLYYRSRVQGRTKHVNALLHYAYIGRYIRISPSPWFDVQFYLSKNKDVARSGIEPIRHYLRWGGLEGRSPNPQFDGAYYLKTNPEIAERRLNPLLHYLQVGRTLARSVRQTTNADPVGINADHAGPMDFQTTWDSMTPKNRHHPPQVDVIVPVYRDRLLTLRCLLTVLTAPNDTPFELIVIDDCSPNKTLKADLQRLAERGLLTLLSNENNCGFVFSANRGVALHRERDVILLNSDTEVYNNWLDRLRTAANRHPRTATVTPLSNNANICSYPRFLHDNPYPLEISYVELDALTAYVNSEFEVDSPTGVGFCMYLRRDALNEIGQFNEALFGKGYGEDNDYCQRAIQHGWHNVIATNIFVRHLGGASFRGEKAERVAAAMEVMDRLHPDYRRTIEKFIRHNELAEARRRLDWARLVAQVREENVLIVCHNRGGGAERDVQEESTRLQKLGKGVFYLRPERGRPTHARLGHPACRQLLNLAPIKLADINTLTTLLKELKISRIHNHGLVDFSPNTPEYILAVAEAIGVPLQTNIHDYEVICPRINLADRDGRYCREPGKQECDTCLANRGNDFGAYSIIKWRSQHHRLLKFSEKILVPDTDVAARLSRYYPKLNFTVAPHEVLDLSAVAVYNPKLHQYERLRIVVIGAISKIKGYDVVLACARDAKKRDLPLDYIVMGYSHNDRLLERAGVVITGQYLEQDAENTLRVLAPHIVWLPSTWPETYSYTLSLALRGGYNVMAFNLGAIGRRLKEAGQARNLTPLRYMDMPPRINRQFIKYRIRHLVSLQT